MAKRNGCYVVLRANVADPNTADGYGAIEALVPCGAIRWNSDRPPTSFALEASDIYSLRASVCRGGETDPTRCPHAECDLDVRGGSFKRRR